MNPNTNQEQEQEQTPAPAPNPTPTHVKVRCAFTLSVAGQKYALLNNLNAAKEQVMDLPLINVDGLLGCVTFENDGTLTYKPAYLPYDSYQPGGWMENYAVLDRVPDTADEFIEHIIAARKVWEAQTAENRRAAKEREEIWVREREIEVSNRIGALLAKLPETPEDQRMDWDYMVSSFTYDANHPRRAEYEAAVAAHEERRKARALAHKQEVDEAEKARIALIKAEGGLGFKVTAGMCGFNGQKLWNQYQTSRWVGVFTKPRGIDRFLVSPKSEHVFDVSQLQPGDCIQGGGFSSNARGKRRNESEFFGVVVRNTEDRLVIQRCETRAMALAEKIRMEKSAPVDVVNEVA